MPINLKKKQQLFLVGPLNAFLQKIHVKLLTKLATVTPGPYSMQVYIIMCNLERTYIVCIHACTHAHMHTHNLKVVFVRLLIMLN